MSNNHYSYSARSADIPDRDETPVCACSCCREPVYPYELVHLIDGQVICPECFFDFTFDYFSDCLIEASELGGD